MRACTSAAFCVPVFLCLTAALGAMLVPATFTTVARGDQSGVEDAREVVVRTAAEWKSLWQVHAPGRPMPPVDFEKAMVVGVFLGFRSSGGYGVTVSAIEREGDALVVSFREDRPAAGAITTQVLTFPYHLVRTDRVPGRVTFRRAGAEGR
jgi:hypothetical protein